MTLDEQLYYWRNLELSRSTLAKKKWPTISIVNDKYIMSNDVCSGDDHWTVLSDIQMEKMRESEEILALNKVRDQGLVRSDRWRQVERDCITSLKTPVILHVRFFFVVVTAAAASIAVFFCYCCCYCATIISYHAIISDAIVISRGVLSKT